MKNLLASLLLLNCLFVSGQSVEKAINVTYNQGGGTRPALLYSPNDYTSTSTKYPLLVFLHGAGESSGGLSSIYNNSSAGGPAYFMEHNGWPTSFTNPSDGQAYKFIVLSPQATNTGWSSSGPELDYMIRFMVSNYRVDVNRIYITGLSAGGAGCVQYVTRTDGNEADYNPQYKLAAFVPMSQANGKASQTLANRISDDNTKGWGFGSDAEDVLGEYTHNLIDGMNIRKAGMGRYTNYSGGHCCWNTYYNPNYKETIGGVSMNIYEWMLTNTRSGATPPSPAAPTVNAGSAQTITLPVTSATLTGSATAASGSSISSYAWSRVSGPNTPIIVSASSASTGITGLISGNYIFRLTVTNNLGASATSDVTIIVNAAVAVAPPVVSAGSNQTITLPAASATLSGSGTPASGHTISGYAWSNVSGPNAALISSATNATTNVTGLILGTYVFRLTVTQSDGQTSNATVSVIVNASGAAYASPTITVSGNQTIAVSSANVTSSPVLSGATLSNLTWTKFSVPGQTKKKVGILGSSTSAAFGPSVYDSSYTGRLLSYYRSQGIIDSVINMAVEGYNAYMAMPTGYVPPTSVTNKLSPWDVPDVNKNITAMLARNPDVVIVNFPTNGFDVLTMNEIMTPFQAIYNACQARGVECYITTTQPRTDATFNTASQNFLQVIRDSILNRFGSHAINFYDPVTTPGTTQMIPWYSYGDNIHLNNAAHQQLFNAVVGANIFQNLISSSATLTTPSANNTSIANLPVGVNKFQATVMDSHKQVASAVTTITVTSALPPPAPVANAGSNQNITLPANQVTLNASGSTGTITSYNWTRISGPASFNITSATSASTTVTGLGQGTYVFQLSLNGSASTAQVTINVNAAASGGGSTPGSICGGKKIYLVPNSDDAGIYMTPTTSFSSSSVKPGDTLVLNAAYSYLDIEGLKGSASCPIVIMNEGVRATISQRLNLDACQYVKVTGSGSGAQYGIYIEQHPTLRQQYFHAISIYNRSKSIEIERVEMHNVDIGIAAETNGGCDPSVNYPNWVMDSIIIHDNRIVGTWNEGMYIGNTSPDNAVNSYDPRPVVCNGVTTYPVPMRNGYTKIYNNYVDSTGRGGIQLASASGGISEIFNNTVKHNGLNGDDAQGTGISIGAYSRAYIHDNNISNTYTWGIASLGGSGTNIPLRIENNTIDSSGYLNHYDLALTTRTSYNPKTETVYPGNLTWPQSIEIDCRTTYYTDSTLFYIKNNVIGKKKNTVAINVENNFGTIQKNGHIICNNVNAGTGTPVTVLVVSGINYTSNCSAPVTANAGGNQTITLPTSSVSLNGSGTASNGNTITAYKWTKVSGGAATLSASSSASTTITGLVQGTYVFRLTVTESTGSTASADAQVIVNAPTASNIIPTLNAGTDMVVTLPVNSVNMSAAASDPDGSVASYSWTKISGPSQFTISNMTIANPLISNLVTGTNYVFRLTITDDKGATASDDITITVNPAVSSNAKNIPGKIEAENFDAMYGIGTETTTDQNAGLDVNRMNKGDWMDYLVNVSTTGSYTVSFRVSASKSGGQLQIRKPDGTILMTQTLPRTGGAQIWQTVSGTLTLTAGIQTIRVISNSSVSWSINWMDYVLKSSQGVTAPPPPSNGTSKLIKASIYGGVNPYNNSEWNNWNVLASLNSSTLKYSDGTTSGVSAALSYSQDVVDNSVDYGGVMAPAEVLRYTSYSYVSRTLTITGLSPTGQYNFEFYAARSSNPGSNSVFIVNQQADTVSSYNNINDKALLNNLTPNAQGQIVVTIKIPGTEGYNYLNGFIITENNTSAAAARTMTATSATLATETSTTTVAKSGTVETSNKLAIYPNPVNDRFMLDIRNNQVGSMSVQIIDQLGAVKSKFNFKKDQSIITINIPASNLKAGIYFVKVQIGSWVETRKIVKL